MELAGHVEGGARMSHLTQSEIDALQLSTLDKATPFLLRWVSKGQLSVARYYGGCTFQGRHYFYLPLTDELIRDDVVRWLAKYRKRQKNRRALLVNFSDDQGERL